MNRDGLFQIFAAMVAATMAPPQAKAAEPWSAAQIAQLCHIGGGGPWTFGEFVAGDALAQLGANSLGPFTTAAAMTTDWSGRVYAVWYVTPSAHRAQSLLRTQAIAHALREAKWVEIYANGFHDDALGYVEAEYQFIPPGATPEDTPIVLAIEGSDSQFRVNCTHSDFDGLNNQELAGKLSEGAIRPTVPPPVTLSAPTPAWCEKGGNAAAYATLMDRNTTAGQHYHRMSARAYQARRFEVWKRWRLIASARFMGAELDAMSSAPLTRLSKDGSLTVLNNALFARVQAAQAGVMAAENDIARCKAMVEVVNASSAIFQLQQDRWALVEPVLDKAARRIGISFRK